MAFGFSSLSSDGTAKSSASASITSGQDPSLAGSNNALSSFFSPDQASYQSGSSASGKLNTPSSDNIGMQLFDALGQEQKMLGGSDHSSMNSLLQNILTAIEQGSAPGLASDASGPASSPTGQSPSTPANNPNQTTSQNPSIDQLFGPVFKQNEDTQQYLSNQIDSMGGPISAR